MMVRTKAQDIFDDVWAIVGLAKRANMCRLSIRTTFTFKSSAAYLAFKIVQGFDPSTDRRIADNPQNSSA
jgi:hypothetical protein